MATFLIWNAGIAVVSSIAIPTAELVSSFQFQVSHNTTLFPGAFRFLMLSLLLRPVSFGFAVINTSRLEGYLWLVFVIVGLRKMDQNVIVAVDHSLQAENAVKC